MQKTLVKILSRKTSTTTVLSNSAIVNSGIENNNSNNNIEIVSSNIQSTVEFKGTSHNDFLFEVKVENPEREEFTLEIRDDNGKIISSEDFVDAHLTKEIKLSNEELTAHYNFIIRTDHKEAEQTFVVSITTRVAEEVETA